MAYQYFGESPTSKKVILKIIDMNRQNELIYGNAGERLAIVKQAEKLLELNIEGFDAESVKAGLFSSYFMHELMKFETNSFDSSANYGGCMYDTCGEEMSYVRGIAKTEPDRIWTICLDGNGESIAQGLHVVNRMGYLVAPINQPTDITFSEEWEDELDD